MIQFSSEIGLWSKLIFWFVVVNAFLTIGFLLVVIVGGMFDLRFLLKAIREEPHDLTDDGRVDDGPSANDNHTETTLPVRADS